MVAIFLAKVSRAISGRMRVYSLRGDWFAN
jgi:hypothetical protein